MAQTLVQAGLSGDANCISYWTFDTNLVPTSGTFTLTNTGTVAFNAGQFSNAADFGNLAGTVRLAGTANSLGIDYSNAGVHSVTGWVKHVNFTGGAVMTQLASVKREFTVKTNSSGAMIITIFDGSSAQNGTIASAFTANTWAHFGYSANGDVVIFYVNGLPQGTTTFSNNGTTNGGNECFIGNNGAVTNGIDGLIDDLGVFNRVLTAAEMNNIANGVPSTSGAVGYKSLLGVGQA